MAARLTSGASGYILKTAEGQELVRAVRATASGQSAIDPAVAPRLIARLTQPLTSTNDLTKRELGVLRLAARTEAVTVGLQRNLITLAQ